MKGFFNLIIGLFLGVIIGIGVMVFYPEPVISLLKIDFRQSDRAVEGRVVAKELRDEKLLLTVVTPEGAVLVTFTKKIPEINLLVEKDDLIALGLNRYRPFVNDPPVLKVKKERFDEVESSERQQPRMIAPVEPEPAPQSIPEDQVEESVPWVSEQ